MSSRRLATWREDRSGRSVDLSDELTTLQQLCMPLTTFSFIFFRGNPTYHDSLPGDLSSSGPSFSARHFGFIRSDRLIERGCLPYQLKFPSGTPCNNPSQLSDLASFTLPSHLPPFLFPHSSSDKPSSLCRSLAQFLPPQSPSQFTLDRNTTPFQVTNNEILGNNPTRNHLLPHRVNNSTGQHRDE